MMRGWIAEEAAHRLLLESGYQPLDRNVRSRFGEIDVVARDGDELVFVEVRARQRRAAVSAADSLDRRKRARLHGLAAFYLVRNGFDTDTKCRFDAVLVTLSASGDVVAVELIRNAW